MKDKTTERYSENQSVKMGNFEGNTKVVVDRSRRKGKWTERRRKPHVEPTLRKMEDEATLFQHACFVFAACLATLWILCHTQCRQAHMTPRPASNCQKRVWGGPLACLREATEAKVTPAVQKYLVRIVYLG